MLSYLVRQAIDNIWCAPSQDLQYNLRLPRISSNLGAISKVRILWEELPLPDKTHRYHVFRLGHIDPVLIGLFNLTPGWNLLSDLVNDSKLFSNIYLMSGKTIPKTLTYVYYDASKTLAIAIKENEHFTEIRQEEPYFRVYTNTYYDSTYKSPGEGTETIGYEIKNDNDRTKAQQDFQGMLMRDGLVIPYLNGYKVDELPPSILQVGDYVEMDHDSSIVKMISLKLSDLHTFNSTLDDKEKYLLHYPSPIDDEVTYFKDEVDIFLVNENHRLGKGVFYHAKLEDSTRMVTHRDYSIPLTYVNGYILDNQSTLISSNETWVHLYIRKSGLKRNIVQEKNRIRDLYKLPENLVVEAMMGINSNVVNWKVENLEHSNFTETMEHVSMEIPNYQVQETYGYNAISKMVGDSPLDVDDYGVGGNISLLPGQVKDSTVYEYDVDGHLLGFKLNLNNKFYETQSPQAVLGEVVVGKVDQGREIVYDVDTLTIDPIYNYRVYRSDRIMSGDRRNWVDVTDTGVVEISGNTLTVDLDLYSHYLAIVNDSKFIGYETPLNKVNGIYTFTVLEDGSPADIPPGNLQLWLNGKALLEGIDYDGHWPEYVIFNKSYLVPGETQQLTVRAKDFCSSDMEIRKLYDKGFIHNGYLSHNGVHDLNHDKVYSVFVDGKLRPIDELDFMEEHDGLIKTSSRNGAPYGMVELFVPFRNELLSGSYAMRDIDMVTDQNVKDYLTLKLPKPTLNQTNQIAEWHMLYSPFLSAILFACENNLISRSFLEGTYNDSQLNEELVDYLELLPFDPAFVGEHKEHVKVEAFPVDGKVEMDIHISNLLGRANKKYLNSTINLAVASNIIINGGTNP